jgi:hypothetical protein
MRYLVFILAFLFAATQGVSQKKLSLVYIDASEPMLNEDYFSDKEIQYLQNFLSDIDSTKLLLFLSDGKRSKVARAGAQRQELLNSIYENTPAQPDWKSDRIKLRDYLFTELEDFAGEIHLHFFLSDKQVKDIISGSNYTLKLLPKELTAASKNSVKKVVVHVYYTNDMGKIDKSKLLTNLNFYNEECPPKVDFELNEI